MACHCSCRRDGSGIPIPGSGNQAFGTGSCVSRLLVPGCWLMFALLRCSKPGFWLSRIALREHSAVTNGSDSRRVIPANISGVQIVLSVMRRSRALDRLPVRLHFRKKKLNSFRTIQVLPIAFLILAAGSTAFHSSAVLAQPMPPYSIEQVSGSGQIAASGQAYARPLVARVRDANGIPVAGVEVHFQAPHCNNDGTICTHDSVYPYFPSHAIDVVALSDADGLATSPAIHAGNHGLSGGDSEAFSFDATISNDVPTAFAIESTRFKLFQVLVLRTVPIAAGFTGSWYNPEQRGHGLTMEVLSDSRVLVNWNAFTPDGLQQAWFGGVGQIIGNQVIVDAVSAEGGRWVGNFDSSQVSIHRWGTLTLTFSDCDHGHVYFASQNGLGQSWGSGDLELTRLTLPAGLSCPQQD